MFNDNKIKTVADKSYYEWLKTQPVSIQNLVIGVRRDYFQPLTLEEMKAKRPEVFKRVNVEL